MPLGRKIVLVLLAVGAVSVLLTAVALRTIVYPTFDALQTRMAESNVARVQQALDAVGMVIDAANRDWSQWDDTYAFVQGKKPDYAEENLYNYSFFEISVNMMLFYDAQGRFFWGQFIDVDTLENFPLEEILIRPFAPEDPLVRHEDVGGGARGVLPTRKGPMIVASRPIVTSQGMGPIAGTVIFGRLLDESQIEELEALTKASFALIPVDDEALSPEERKALEHVARGEIHHTQSEELQLSYDLIRSVHGVPAFLLRVDSAREITAVGLNAIFLAALFFALTALFPVGSSWLLIQRMIVAPLSGLTHHMLDLRRSRDLSRRIDLRRGDEIGTLADQFDSLTADLERARREMADARDAALEVARLKSEFLAAMSHEIRTPMNGVIGMADMLLDTELTSRQREFAKTIQSSADGLLGIVNDILDFSKLEARGVELERRDFALGDLVEEVVRAFEGTARENGLDLGCRIPPEVDGTYQGDPGRLRQILLNFAGNAVKFTAEGEISIGVSAQAEDGDERRIRFEVRDTGIGVSPEQRGRIFDSFARADASTTRRHGGTGLGLAISRHLVDMMGGEIGVESEVDAGSTFWFVVPLRRRDGVSVSDWAPAAPEPTRAIRMEGRILVAEDNPVNQRVALAMLEALGCRVDVVEDGEKALEALAETSYDAVLMDCEMPSMDGFEATARIRRREPESNSQRRVLILAVTAHAVEGARERCLAADMDGYLSKPFRREQLIRALQPWLPEAAPQPESEPAEIGSASDAPPEREDTADPLDHEVLDTLRALQPSDGSSLLDKLIGVYRSSSAGLLAELSEAVERGDAEAIRQAAHALKSSSLNVGARIVGALCRELESKGRAGELEDVKDLLARITGEYDRALEALEAESAL